VVDEDLAQVTERTKEIILELTQKEEGELTELERRLLQEVANMEEDTLEAIGLDTEIVQEALDTLIRDTELSLAEQAEISVSLVGQAVIDTGAIYPGITQDILDEVDKATGQTEVDHASLVGEVKDNTDTSLAEWQASYGTILGSIFNFIEEAVYTIADWISYAFVFWAEVLIDVLDRPLKLLFERIRDFLFEEVS